VLLVQGGFAESREKAQALVLAGDVLVNGQKATKPGISYAPESVLEVKRPLPYVSRGGVKLERALDVFGFSPQGLVALDVGASTGGFTDCLLKREARRVYAVDSGIGQLDWKLRSDSRVISMERTNIRNLELLPELVDAIVADVSFISLRLALPPAIRLAKPDSWVAALVKPQFEVGKGKVGKGGVVRDRADHRSVLWDTLVWARAANLVVVGLTPSPLRGPAGNVEFLVGLRLPAGDPVSALSDQGIENAVEECLNQIAAATENG
jgi:23S rRNA (cytidine1920-2'-O)/16S rRNA (cytidine1409-2'-O)-methyltransferase